MERRRRGEPVAFPDIAVSHHMMTVEQLEELDYFVRDFEGTLVENSPDGTGVPVEWWYGRAQEETTIRVERNPEPLRSRGVDLLSSPTRTAHFWTTDERLRGVNASFEACWDFLKDICALSSIEGVEEHYDIDPHDVARMLLADTSGA
jgi:hypothetical protein